MASSRTESSVEEEPSNTAIAIDRDKNSQVAVKWAVDNLLSRSSHCILVHVRVQSFHPQDLESIPKRERPPTDAEFQQFFLPYRGFCARRGIEAKEVILNDIDIASALVDFIANNSISNIVVGASNRNALTRKFRNTDVPSTLLKSAPKSCAVYVISKGRVQATRPAGRPQSPAATTDSPRQRPQRAPINSRSPRSLDAEDINRTSIGRGSRRSTGSNKSIDSLQITTRKQHGSSSRTDSQTLSFDSRVSGNSSLENSDSSEPLSFQSNSSEIESSSDSPRSSGSSQTLRALEVEMRRLKLELKQTMGMYNSACKEVAANKQKARELQQWKTEKELKLEQAKLGEEVALALAEVERQKAMAAMEASRMQRRLVEMETQKRKGVEMKAYQEVEERKRATESPPTSVVKYRRYTIDDIEVATDHFNISQKIGEGGYGPVYKGLLDNTAVAIKILRPDLPRGQEQFQREVEVLSSLRHPHMVLLLGACPEYCCLVYEYMDNGSLQDRLFRKDDTPSIPWATRFKIAAEIATALLFLHQTKPEPLVHRDLKPANILLDRHYHSKIGDVGLARLVPPSVADKVTDYLQTSAAGTFCYIDPEYQQTGLLGVKSDIYSLGVVLLQLITARPPIGLSFQVEEAIEGGSLSEILDPTLTDWPVEEAMSLAKLALKCCELRKRDRPNLLSVVVPELNRLRDLGLVYETSKSQKKINAPRAYNSDSEVRSTVDEDQDELNDHDVELNDPCISF